MYFRHYCWWMIQLSSRQDDFKVAIANANMSTTNHVGSLPGRSALGVQTGKTCSMATDWVTDPVHSAFLHDKKRHIIHGLGWGGGVEGG